VIEPLGAVPARSTSAGRAANTLGGKPRRAGATANGSITAFYSVLVEGDDLDEPIADELRGVLDGHIVLSRELASRGHFPAVDVPKSLSRLMDRVADASSRADAAAVRAHLALYEQKRDLIALGAYSVGSDKKLDAAITRMEHIEPFLRQDSREACPLEQTLAGLAKLV